MHIWFDLLAREGAFLAMMFLIGSGPAALLSAPFDAASRLALAPLLGFCAGSAVATTLLEFAPANSTYWILVPLALVSAAIAVRCTFRGADPRPWRERLPIGDIAQLAVVCVVVAGPLTYALQDRQTVGPADYYFTDVAGYVAQQDGARTTSIGDASREWTQAQQTGTRFANLTKFNWDFLANFDQNLDAVPLEANADALLGLGATATFSPFLIVLLVTGALGAFAAVRHTTRSRTWGATLAGALFGGPFFLELFFDTYEAALVGLGLVLPLFVVGRDALASGRTADLVLCALVLSGFVTVYPLFVPLVVLAVGAALAGIAVRRRRERAAIRSLARTTARRLAVIGAVACALEPVAFVRDLDYARKVIDGAIPLPRVAYHLPLDVLPGWLLQSREFWAIPPLGIGGFKQIVLGALIPLCVLALIAFGVWRHRAALALVLLAGVCALLAEYSFASQDACTYCAERNLLPLAPIGAALAALGVSALVTSRSFRNRALATAGALLVIASVGQRARIELTRFVNGSYFLDSATRSVLSKLPHDAATVEVEGFGASLFAQSEQALVYHLVNEHVPGGASIVVSANDYSGNAYLNFGQTLPPGPEFHPDYRFVLTRLAGVRTDRRVLALSGGIALQERVRSLDVTPISGLGVPLARLDPAGLAWVQTPKPLVFYVTGQSDAPKVWARLTFRSSEQVAQAPQPGVHSRERGNLLTACVPAVGRSPIRVATLRLIAAPVSGPVPHGLFPPPVPLEGIALTEMRVTAPGCTP